MSFGAFFAIKRDRVDLSLSEAYSQPMPASKKGKRKPSDIRSSNFEEQLTPGMRELLKEHRRKKAAEKKAADPPTPTEKPWATDPPPPTPTEKPWAYGPGSDAPDPSPAPLAPIPESDDPFLTKGDVAEAALSLASLAADVKRESRFKDFDVKQKRLGKKALGKALKFGAKPLSIALDAKEAFDLVTDPEARKEAREMTEQMSKESVGMRLLKSQADPVNTLYGAGSALVEGGKARDRAEAAELQYQKLAVVQKYMEDKYPRKKGVRRTLKEQLEMGAIRQKLLSDVAEVPRRRGGGRLARKFVFPDGTVEPFIKPK